MSRLLVDLSNIPISLELVDICGTDKTMTSIFEGPDVYGLMRYRDDLEIVIKRSPPENPVASEVCSPRQKASNILIEKEELRCLSFLLLT